MRRREFITVVGGAAAWPLVAHAQKPQSAPRIGYLSDETEGPHPFNSHGSVLDALRSLGYEEGRNVTIEYRYAAGHVERLPSLQPNWLRCQSTLFFLSVRLPPKPLLPQLKRFLLFLHVL